MDKSHLKLIGSARQAREHAYAPYSQFKVGAAVLADDGRIFVGSNVENASYGATMCAERTAIFSAIAGGAKKIKAIAVIAEYPTPIPPCGLCRQVIAEFGKDIVVIMGNLAGDSTILSIQELLPLAFDLSTAGRGATSDGRKGERDGELS